MKGVLIYILLFFLFLQFGCSPSSCDTYEEYLSYLNDEENGLVKYRKSKGMTISLKYLPTDFLVYRELGNISVKNQKILDSLRGQYTESITFLMTIEPDAHEEKSNQRDITFEGIGNYEQYKERILLMSFGIESRIDLKTDKGDFVPVLVNMEQSFGLKKGRDFIVVFVPGKGTSKDFFNSSTYDFIYDDEIFDLGINHFVFDKKDIDALPKLNFRI
jgi:hypothetical protein